MGAPPTGQGSILTATNTNTTLSDSWNAPKGRPIARSGTVTGYDGRFIYVAGGEGHHAGTSPVSSTIPPTH